MEKETRPYIIDIEGKKRYFEDKSGYPNEEAWATHKEEVRKVLELFYEQGATVEKFQGEWPQVEGEEFTLTEKERAFEESRGIPSAEQFGGGS